MGYLLGLVGLALAVLALGGLVAVSRQARPQVDLKPQVLGLMSELAQAKEIQLALLTDLEKALEKQSELQSQLESVLRKQSENQMDSSVESVMLPQWGSQKAWLSGSVLVEQEAPVLD